MKGSYDSLDIRVIFERWETGKEQYRREVHCKNMMYKDNKKRWKQIRGNFMVQQWRAIDVAQEKKGEKRTKFRNGKKKE